MILFVFAALQNLKKHTFTLNYWDSAFKCNQLQGFAFLNSPYCGVLVMFLSDRKGPKHGLNVC